MNDRANRRRTSCRRRLACLSLLAALVPSTAHAEPGAFERGWPQWRGPLATGEAPHADPPVRWSESENVRWKTALPGRGHSTPAVWEARIFLTAAVASSEAGKAIPPHAHPDGAHDNVTRLRRQRFVVLAVDRADGEIVWQRAVREALPHEGGHVTASYASPSPIADGERVYAFFGSHGLYALDAGDGKVLWQADLGDMATKHGHGEGASPVLHGDTLVVNWDHEGESFVAAFDAASGKRRWRAARDEPTSWATPIVIDRGQPQAVVSGTGRVRGYDLATGKVTWEAGGLSHNVVASPVFDRAHGLVVAGSSYEHQALFAIRVDGAKGDLTGTARIVWRRPRGTPYVPSPLLYQGNLYVLHHYQSVMSRLDVATGRDAPGAFRLGGLRNIYASPVAAAGRVYITDLDGATLVLRAGERPEPLALNRLDDRFSASAALAGRDLLLRGERYLYCLGEPRPPPSRSKQAASLALRR